MQDLNTLMQDFFLLGANGYDTSTKFSKLFAYTLFPSTSNTVDMRFVHVLKGNTQ